MKRFGMQNFISVVGIALVLTLLVPTSALAAVIEPGDTGGRPIMVSMTGAEEAPGPGDSDGSGTAFFTLNQGQGEVCFELTAQNIEPAAAAHIHRAPAGSPGSVVIPLIPPTAGVSSGCVAADPGLIMEIRQFPERFYVNVHNALFPAGAIRGQLSK